MSTPALNPLVDKIRQAHPGAYDDMDDAMLTKRVLAKYPQYSDLAAPKLEQPVKPQEEPSAASRFGQSFLRNIGYNPELGSKLLSREAPGALGSIASGLVRSQGELGKQAYGELKSGDYAHAVPHAIEYMLPGIGPPLAQAGEQFEKGDIAGGLGSTAGIAAPILSPNPISVAGEAGGAALRGVRAIGERVTPKQVAQVAGGTAGAIGGHGLLSIPGAHYGIEMLGNSAEKILGKERANAPILRPKVAPEPPPPSIETDPGLATLRARRTAIQQGERPATPIKGPGPQARPIEPAPPITPEEARTPADTSADIDRIIQKDPTLGPQERMMQARSSAAEQEAYPNAEALHSGLGRIRSLTGEGPLHPVPDIFKQTEAPTYQTFPRVFERIPQPRGYGNAIEESGLTEDLNRQLNESGRKAYKEKYDEYRAKNYADVPKYARQLKFQALRDKLGNDAEVVGSQATGKATESSDLDLKADNIDKVRGKLESEGYESRGSSVVSPKEAAAYKKPINKGWSRVHHFEDKNGNKVDVWTSAKEEKALQVEGKPVEANTDLTDALEKSRRKAQKGKGR